MRKKRRKKNQSLRKESSRGKCPRHLPWCDRQWTYVLRIQSHNCHRNINITLLSDHIRLWQRSTTIVFAYNKKNRQAKRYSMCQCSAPPRFPFCCSKCHVYHKDAKHATPRTKEWIKKHYKNAIKKSTACVAVCCVPCKVVWRCLVLEVRLDTILWCEQQRPYPCAGPWTAKSQPCQHSV